MRASCATPRASRVSAAWRMVAQSDWLPMMMATGAPAMIGSHKASVHAPGIAKPPPASKVRARCCSGFSGDDVGGELVFQPDDLILEDELALLEALDLKLVARDH